MRHSLFFFALFASLLGWAQNTNYATVSGNWDNCATWGNPANLYNSHWCDKIIYPNVTVTQNVATSWYAQKITLAPGSKIVLPNLNNRIDFSTQASMTETVCDNTVDLLDKININFAETVNAKSLIGYIHGLYNDTPSEASILELRPKLSRQGYTQLYEKAYDITSTATSKGRVHMQLSDLWRDQHTTLVPAVNGYDVLPTAYVAAYQTYLNDFFTWGSQPDANGTSPKPGIVWECWNEPNAPNFWNPADRGAGTDQWQPGSTTDLNAHRWPAAKKAQFFETYKIFYNTLKGSALGCGAVVAGPSLAYFDKIQMKDFFDYCLSQKLQVNVVTWHELNDQGLDLMKENVLWVRQNFMNNSKYAALNIQSIEINEIVGETLKDNPAGTAQYLCLLEQANVDAAAKACWSDSSSLPLGCCDACYSNTLNHIFTPNNLKRPNWFAHKWYGDGVSSRVASTNELTGNSFSIASRNIVGSTQPYAQVLFGYTDTWDGDPNHFQVDNTGKFKINLTNMSALSFITGSTCYYVIKEVLKPTDETSPATINTKPTVGPVSITGNSLSISVDVVQDRLYQLTIYNSAP